MSNASYIRTIYLNSKEKKAIHKQAKKEGGTPNGIIRKAINYYLQQQENEQAQFESDDSKVPFAKENKKIKPQKEE